MRNDISVGLLIGANCVKALEPIQIIPSRDGGPYALKTKLGWCIVGPVDGINKGEICCNSITVKKADTEKVGEQYLQVRSKVQSEIRRRTNHQVIEPADKNDSEKKNGVKAHSTGMEIITVRKSSILKTDPFPDLRNELKAGGRLGRSRPNKVHSVIPPKIGLTTDVIVKWCHKCASLDSKRIVLNKIRWNILWIENGNAVNNNVLLKDGKWPMCRMVGVEAYSNNRSVKLDVNNTTLRRKTSNIVLFGEDDVV